MQILPINLTDIIAVVMGISIVLIPVIGLTARFALKPVVEAISRVLETRGMDESLQILERRISLLEAQIETLDSTVNRLDEAASFHSQLQSGSGTGSDQPPTP